MPAIQPRIFHKGLILLFVPLLFELVVAMTMIFLQHYYGEAVKAEALRKQIVFHINQFWYHNMHMLTNNLGIFLDRSFSPDWTTADSAVAEYTLLSKQLEQDPQQLKRLAYIIDCHKRCRALCSELKPPSSAGGLGEILALRSNLKTCKQLLAANLEAGNLVRSFREYELDHSARAAEKVHLIAGLIQLVLAGAILGSAVIAYLLFRYFMRGIHRGVQALTLNIQRFKTGQALSPAIEGTDELALLDARFHEMADKVATAQRMKQAFITTISRELRTPISSTREYLTHLSGGSVGALSEQGRVHAQKIVKTLERLIGLMNDFLTLQAPGMSRVEIQPRQCSLNEVIQASMDTVSTYADKNGIHLEGADTQMTVYADPDRIVQVLVNLLSNAIKFSPGGSSVFVSATHIDDEVEVRVKDTGRGVPADMREAVFQRFQQVAATDATEKGGTGLGLPICKEIIERHGGSIGVESEEGKGSTFWFRLPRSPAAAAEAPAASAGLPVPQPRSKGWRITPRTIYEKGLILISIPLLVELAFGFTMFSLQRDYKEKLAKERAAVEIIFHANELWIDCTEVMMMKAYFSLFGGPKPPFEDRTARIIDENRILKKLVAGDSQQEMLDKMRSYTNMIVKLSDQLIPVASQGQSTTGKMKIMMSNLDVFQQAKIVINEFSAQIKAFQSESPEFLGSDPAANVAKATSFVDRMVLESLAASTLVAVSLFVYFIRSIDKEVKVLVENTERFKQGEELTSPVEGADELAQVDAAFHEMADEITAAERTKQAIVSMISHDLRSPLTSVSGYFSLLTAGAFGGLSAASMADAGKREREVKRLIRLITDLLDLDKIEAGKLALEPRVLSVEQVMERAMGKVASSAEDSGVIISAAETGAEIYADLDRIVQALANLLSNAVKMSPRNSRVDVSVIQDDSGVEVRVTSAGASISAVQPGTLFDRYQQREADLSLELPLSMEIIKLHGGAIGATSEQPQGCTLWFRLPAAEPSDQAA